MTSVPVITESTLSRESGRCFEENEIKHLELVQSVISRMAQNSFHIKGWSVMLATAVFALAAKESSPALAILALFPTVSFWCLDAYYLRQERLYRKLYEAILDPSRVIYPFSMITDVFSGEVTSWPNTLMARAIFPLHTTIVLVILIEVSAFIVRLGITNFKG